MSLRRMFVYVLQLENNKWYVGSTQYPVARLEAHAQRVGSQWTRTHPLVRIHQCVPNCDRYDELKWTLQLMTQHGVDNVRGGPYCQVTLSDTDRASIRKIMDSVSNKCYRCGKFGHFIRDCSPSPPVEAPPVETQPSPIVVPEPSYADTFREMCASIKTFFGIRGNVRVSH